MLVIGHFTVLNHSRCVIYALENYAHLFKMNRNVWEGRIKKVGNNYYYYTHSLIILWSFVGQVIIKIEFPRKRFIFRSDQLAYVTSLIKLIIHIFPSKKDKHLNHLPPHAKKELLIASNMHKFRLCFKNGHLWPEMWQITK